MVFACLSLACFSCKILFRLQSESAATVLAAFHAADRMTAATWDPRRHSQQMMKHFVGCRCCHRSWIDCAQRKLTSGESSWLARAENCDCRFPLRCCCLARTCEWSENYEPLSRDFRLTSRWHVHSLPNLWAHGEEFFCQKMPATWRR